jgi:superfamily II DNA or RNA helicase
MKALISDKIYLNEVSAAGERIKKALTFRNPKYDAAVKFDYATWDIPKTLKLYEETDYLEIPRGHISLVKDFDIDDQRNSYPVKFETIIETRSYQERAIRLALAKDNGVIVAPTGSGKTTMGIELASRLGERCLILVKSKDLATQWIGAIKQFTGLECGLIGGGKWQEGKEFTVALVQTLIKSDRLLDYGLTIVDECHNIPAAQAYAVINRQTAKYRFGLSATPQRRDNLEFMITAALGEIVAEITQADVTGSVLPVHVATKYYNFLGNPESWPEFINLLANDEERNQMLISSAIKSSRGVGTALLTGTIAHAEKLHSLAKSYGVNALLLHGQLPAKQRAQGMMDAGQYNLIIGTLALLSEGIDWPHIGNVIFGCPVSAEVDRPDPAATRLLQAIGRGRRPYPGKWVTHVLDIIDNCAFGKSAFRKRSVIYQQQGFFVKAI